MDAEPLPVALPNWPALMDEDMSSSYLQMERRTFRALATSHHLAPVDVGARLLRWRRTDLDRLVEALPAKGETLQAGSPGPTIEETIARVSRRRRH